VIESFKTKGTADIFDGINSQEARKTCPNSLWKIAARKLDLLDNAPGKIAFALTANTVSVSSGKKMDPIR